MGAAPYASYLYPPISYPWWKYGLVAWPPRRLNRRQKLMVILWYAFVSGAVSSLVTALVYLLDFLR